MNIQKAIQSASQYYQAGNLKQAEILCIKILKKQPPNTKILNLLGTIYFQLQHYDTAIKYLNKTLQFDPHNGQVYCNLGAVLIKKGIFDEAMICFKKSLELDPNNASAHNNLGYILKEKGQFDEALVCYQNALKLSPNNANICDNIGIALFRKGLLDEAITFFKKAIHLNPHYSDAYGNLGAVLHEKGELDEAITYFKRELQLNPLSAEAFHNMGKVFLVKGQTQEAFPYFQKAIQLKPHNAIAHFHLSIVLLLTGNFIKGWEEYEWRWGLEDARQRPFPQPEWDGSSLKGKTLFIYDEQGVGDEIMFASCLPEVMEQTDRCIIETDKRLIPLFIRSFPGAKVIGRIDNYDASLPEALSADVKVAIGSLSRFFRTDLSKFPQRKPYLIADEEKVSKWHKRLKEIGEGLKVGISWRGGKELNIQRKRSIPIEHWVELLTIPKCKFINLQYGDCTEEKKTLREKFGIILHDWEDADPLKDLDNFAAQISALDLVISVDNSTVHMAGALGIPVWTLLPFACEWRWMQDCDDTPWYKSMRLFRQKTLGDWCSVIERVKEALEEFLKNFELASPECFLDSTKNKHVSGHCK